jgi:hypothetical protein
MRIERFYSHEIDRNWHWIAQFLKPAFDTDPNCIPANLRLKLIMGGAGLTSVHVDGGVCLVTLVPGTYDGVFGCWMPYVVGKLKRGPRAWRAMAIEMMDRFETSARNAGCKAMLIGGRDWSFLPGYERFDDMPNRLRKVL